MAMRIARGESPGEPTAADLAAIEAEWPLIDAELALLDEEIRRLSAAGGPSPLDWRRLRRAERRVLAARLIAGRQAAAARAWIEAGRDGEHEAWRALYATLYPAHGCEDAAGVAS
ncbi:MAG: DUF6284 family protein [Streptosporangiaceae bacterium]